MQWMTITSIVPFFCSTRSTSCCCITVWTVESNHDFQNRLCISGLSISRNTGFTLEFPSPRWIAGYGQDLIIPFHQDYSPKHGSKPTLLQFPKKTTPQTLQNYCPISLLGAVGKVLEKLVHKYVLSFCRDNAITCISSLQSGFVQGDSTVNQPIDIYNTFLKLSMKARKFVSYSVMSAKPSIEFGTQVYRAGISGPLLSWFTRGIKHDF